ncbi:hypothetical protein GGS23DRAFT_309117 [Durotheca rogersii]|uniref:uncharacterized protein n=1 Tax=Durotheca rogersii TaxID=419775 RepID=UPI00221EA78E|nr:uncharacterized protein GGS23DRAFT_309117 [Durotheca rogersii]KAI5859662.1 hypothetical protein GGS23DRAFT_309117 [Durotheca rogersii]
MAPSYSNGYGYPSSAFPVPSSSYEYGHRNQAELHSICDDISSGARTMLVQLWAYASGRGRHAAYGLAMRAAYQFRRNMVRRRLLSLPHLLVALWVLVLLWGERWVFASRVRSCDWDHWEDWPDGATPHRLIFVADPQIIDPHSYPGRPWPLNPLTIVITDNYMRRSYRQLQTVLRPDTVFFLGDLFDGGREWKTAHGDFEDPVWAKGHRPADEQRYLNQWRKKYGESFWLKEYARFGSIFYDTWSLGGRFPSPGQRGRKLISSLPGNHDLGFGAEVKVPTRHRFSAYFGETNRIDVIGNHTFVSVDTVSLSAGTSSMKDQVDLRPIFAPAHEFLREAKAAKRRAVQKELRFWRGEVEELVFEQKVEDLDTVVYDELPTIDPGEGVPDFPTVLLTHVPLYRPPGTPCGPLREHWPPTPPPKGQPGPVIPDHRNAISISHGYQYKNVLSLEDSIMLIESIGNVRHTFSGDDHDYCEVVHTDKENTREITVKSFSMAMGVPTPGFQMVSLYNPVDGQGIPLPGSPGTTLQTHLCLLPNQLSMFMTYAALGALTVLVLIVRAFLVPVLNLQTFALGPGQRPSSAAAALLPIFKAKDERSGDGDGSAYDTRPVTSSTSSSKFPSARAPSTRTRGQSISSSNGTAPPQRGGASLPSSASASSAKGKWGWAQSRGPRIEIRKDAYYDDGGRGARLGRGGAWRPASSSSPSSLRSRGAMGVVVREILTTTWRVVWMALLFFTYLAYRG